MLEQEFRRFNRTAAEAAFLIDEARRLKVSPGRVKDAAYLALDAHRLAPDDRSIRYTTIDIFNTYARQLLDAGLIGDSLNTSLFMRDILGLVDGITHRNLAAAYHRLGCPDEAIVEIVQALREMPDHVWFHIVAAECYILKALQQRDIYASEWEAQRYMYQAADQLGRAYTRGDKEVRKQASFFLSVIIESKLTNDWTQLFGGLGQLGRNLNLDQQSLRAIRRSRPSAEDSQQEIRRLLGILKGPRPKQKALPEVYTQVIYALGGGHDNNIDN